MYPPMKQGVPFACITGSLSTADFAVPDGFFQSSDQSMPTLLPPSSAISPNPPPFSTFSPSHLPIHQDNTGFLSFGAVWYPFYAKDCEFCVVFREIVHANDFYTMNLSLHVYSDVLQHAKLVIFPLAQDRPAEKYITDLRLLDVESVEQFIIMYCSSCIQDGLILVKDSFQPFLETLTSTMDYSDQHIFPSTPMEYQAGPLFQQTNNFSEYCNQNQSEIGNSTLTSAAGHFNQVLEQRQPTQNSDNEIEIGECRTFMMNQRERTKNMTFDDIAKYFHLPISQAANELQISPTALKNVCRRFKLNRWPYRKILSTSMKIFTGNECLKYQNDSMAAHTLQLIEFDHSEIQKIYCLPATD